MTPQDLLINLFLVVHILCVIAGAVFATIYYMDYIELYTFDKPSENQKFYEKHNFRPIWNSGD